MATDLMNIKLGDAKKIFAKILDGLDKNEWKLKVDRVFDPDPGTDSYIYCYRVIGEHEKKKIRMTVYPDNHPMYTPAFLIILEDGEEYKLNDCHDFTGVTRIEAFDNMISKLTPMVEKYAENKNKKEEQQRAKERRKHFDDKAITLINSL